MVAMELVYYLVQVLHQLLVTVCAGPSAFNPVMWARAHHSLARSLRRNPSPVQAHTTVYREFLNNYIIFLLSC